MKIPLMSGEIKEIDTDTPPMNPRAEAIRQLEERRKAMEPTVETIEATGIVATFKDGAIITLTVNGLFPCTLCNARQCKHLYVALPYWNRFKWDTATRPDCPWGPSLLQGIGIAPPYIVDPALVYKQSRWAPLGRGEEIALGVRMWYAGYGRLYHFWDNGRKLSNKERLPDGHVYVGDDHPDGHTDCLVCRDGCSHVKRALRLAGRVRWTNSRNGKTGLT